ncbi:uncharacterized protein LOC143032314 [Oratosquilla oratoria]|uniref:uncharacterized protein LOC143032314 n=1 Tax=Oratosquilla oratoria TaxID=337810 RepID=UPI003F772FE9
MASRDKGSPLNYNQKLYLVLLIKDNPATVDKAGDHNSIARKKTAWDRVTHQYNLKFPQAEPKTTNQLKRAWEYIRNRIRKEYAEYIRKASTEGNCSPNASESLNELTLVTMSIMDGDQLPAQDISDGVDTYSARQDTPDPLSTESSPLNNNQKLYLMQLIRDNPAIVDKAGDHDSIAKKKSAWDHVAFQYNLKFSLMEPKTARQLKRAWEYIRNRTKKEFAEYIKKLRESDVGSCPIPPKPLSEVSMVAKSLMYADLQSAVDIIDNADACSIHHDETDPSTVEESPLDYYQKLCLVLLIKENSAVLDKTGDNYSAAEKKTAWERITHQYNINFPLSEPRTVCQLKQDWEYIKNRVKEEDAEFFRRLHENDGGSSPPPEPLDKLTTVAKTLMYAEAHPTHNTYDGIDVGNAPHDMNGSTSREENDNEPVDSKLFVLPPEELMQPQQQSSSSSVSREGTPSPVPSCNSVNDDIGAYSGPQQKRTTIKRKADDDKRDIYKRIRTDQQQFKEKLQVMIEESLGAVVIKAENVADITTDNISRVADTSIDSMNKAGTLVDSATHNINRLTDCAIDNMERITKVFEKIGDVFAKVGDAVVHYLQSKSNQ